VGGSAGGGAGSAAGGACAAPTSAVQNLPPFQAPPVGALGAFQVTFHNRCDEPVWPAWSASGGLDNSVIDTQLWLPLEPAGDRTVTVYGGVRQLGFWARTACSFDRDGVGICRTGDCGGIVCPVEVNRFPSSATVFLLNQGFLAGYNVAVRVEGATCDVHECDVNITTCSRESAVEDGCGHIIACSDICDGSTAACCRRTGSGCNANQPATDAGNAGDIVITFCP
jgi:hypothetical protein